VQEAVPSPTRGISDANIPKPRAAAPAGAETADAGARTADVGAGRVRTVTEELHVYDFDGTLAGLGHLSPRYFAVKTPVDDSQDGPCNQSDTPRE
jgi:hypothetical protein